MNYKILFFAAAVQAQIEKWPVGMYASFVKKTQATPVKELRLAKQRMKEVLNG